MSQEQQKDFERMVKAIPKMIDALDRVAPYLSSRGIHQMDDEAWALYTWTIRALHAAKVGDLPDTHK